jgi:hypothetical protein
MVQLLSFDVISEVTFSKAFGFLETGTDVGGSIENSRILTFYVAVMGYFQTIHRLTLGNPLIRKLGLTPSQHILDTVRRTVTARKSNPDKRADMLEQWMLQLKEHPERFEENELYGVANGTVGGWRQYNKCHTASILVLSLEESSRPCKGP